MNANVRLGYEVGTGEPVDIPIRHMAVAGQTQESGKTTTLEALVERSQLRALTFVTKRGEASFLQTCRRVEPYFREQTDWQFVASILEASRGEKLKIERAFIIRASKGARTLADVQTNVRVQIANPRLRGLAADIYLCLDAYLDVVVPQIQSVKWADRVQLSPGVNTMDLSDMPVEMQHLVIRSSITWVLEREHSTVVVVPEAWKFIPQGRGTPVKLAAEAYIRQGAALGNYLWLDSQDIGGIEKTILRSVPVWLLGVQREANEIKRTLANIPASVKKPKAADIATLGLGQFYACWGHHAVKTYVQPGWMDDRRAQLTATGVLPPLAAMPVSVGRPLRAELEQRMKDVFNLDQIIKEATGYQEDEVNAAEAQGLRDENASLKNQNTTLARRVSDLERRIHDLAGAPVRDEPRRSSGAPKDAAPPTGSSNVEPPTNARAFSVEESLDNERLYQAIKARLTEEAPGLLQVLVTKLELTVTIQRRRIDADGTSAVGRVAQLIAEGWFDEPRSAYSAWNESKRRGFAGAAARMDEACKKLLEQGFLTRESDGFQAVDGMKVNIVEAA